MRFIANIFQSPFQISVLQSLDLFQKLPSLYKPKALCLSSECLLDFNLSFLPVSIPNNLTHAHWTTACRCPSISQVTRGSASVWPSARTPRIGTGQSHFSSSVTLTQCGLEHWAWCDYGEGVLSLSGTQGTMPLTTASVSTWIPYWLWYLQNHIKGLRWSYKKAKDYSEHWDGFLFIGEAQF